jgi:hypothetical protein
MDDDLSTTYTVPLAGTFSAWSTERLEIHREGLIAALLFCAGISRSKTERAIPFVTFVGLPGEPVLSPIDSVLPAAAITLTTPRT